jgi:pimeloyl-ACP methyl ester carboxylesterase
LVFQAEFAEALRQRAGVTDQQVDTEYGNDPAPRGPLNWRWVQAILRAVDKNAPGMNQRAIEAFTRDVFLYTTRAGVRDDIDRIVGAKLTEEPTVVVGHSLGSVVAYSVLRTDRRAIQVPLFVTVGSPLAVRAVRDQFRPLRSPASVRAWYNAFDPRDVVALYPLDGDNFPVQPAIENYPRVNNHTDNRHGIDGYLDDTDVARRIATALRSDL